MSVIFICFLCSVFQRGVSRLGVWDLKSHHFALLGSGGSVGFGVGARTMLFSGDFNGVPGFLKWGLARHCVGESLCHKVVHTYLIDMLLPHMYR